VVATAATLFVLPSFFTALLGKTTVNSPSLDYEDPESAYFANPVATPEHS